MKVRCLKLKTLSAPKMMTHKEKIKLINTIYRNVIGMVNFVEHRVDIAIYDYCDDEGEEFSAEDLKDIKWLLVSIEQDMQDEWEELSKENDDS